MELHFGREITPAGLIIILVVAGLLAVGRELLDTDGSLGRKAESGRVQDQMKQYQDEWEQKHTEAATDPRDDAERRG